MVPDIPGGVRAFRHPERAARAPLKESTPYARFLLFVMNMTNYPMYEGTVPRKEKLRRRAKNKVARRSRRINRG
jgi:hypothetical protein